MVNASNSRLASIERWSSTLFLIGGGLLVGHAVLLSVQAFTRLSTPQDVFGPIGHLIALAGVLGLYPTLVRRMSRVARVAGTVAVVALMSWTVMTVMRFLALAGIFSSVSDVLPSVFFIFLFASTILTYILFGVATVRADDSPRNVGLLLLTPAVLLVVALVKSALSGVTDLDGIVIGGGLALSMLALSYTLQMRDRPTDHEVPVDEATTG